MRAHGALVLHPGKPPGIQPMKKQPFQEEWLFVILCRSEIITGFWSYADCITTPQATEIQIR